MKLLEVVQMFRGLKKIHDHFGPCNGKMKLREECAEYAESREPQEIADVFVSSARLVFNDPKLIKLVFFKIARTIERIDNGYYETRKD